MQITNTYSIVRFWLIVICFGGVLYIVCLLSSLYGAAELLRSSNATTIRYAAVGKRSLWYLRVHTSYWGRYTEWQLVDSVKPDSDAKLLVRMHRIWIQSLQYAESNGDLVGESVPKYVRDNVANVELSGRQLLDGYTITTVPLFNLFTVSSPSLNNNGIIIYISNRMGKLFGIPSVQVAIVAHVRSHLVCAAACIAASFFCMLTSRRLISTRRVRAKLCKWCGYNLNTSNIICPECGRVNS